MRLTAILPAALLFTAIQLVAAEYGSLSRVTISGKIYTPAPAPRVAPAADGSTTYIERQTVSDLTESNVLQALVTRSIIPSAKGYSLGLLSRGEIDDAQVFIAYRQNGPATSARRVPDDLLTLDYQIGPREGTYHSTSADKLIDVDLVSQDYAKLTVLDFEGIGILTHRHTNLPGKKLPLNQVVLSTANGVFPGINAPDSGNAGLGTLSLSLSDAKIIDLTPFGDVAPNRNSTTTSGAVTTTSGGTLYVGGNDIYTGGNTTIIGGNLTIGSGSTLGGNVTFAGGNLTVINASPHGGTNTSGTILNSGNLTVASGSNLGFTGTIRLNGGGSLNGGVISAGGNIIIDTTSGATLPGLVVDTDGNITQLPTFTTGTGPTRLTIITSTGTHVYTRDSNNAWTLATP